MCQKTCDLKPSHSVANLFAPCKKFFENVFNLVGELELTYNCQNIIIGGDFIMNFKQSEVKNRVEPLFFDFREFRRKVEELYFNFERRVPDLRLVETGELEQRNS